MTLRFESRLSLNIFQVAFQLLKLIALMFHPQLTYLFFSYIRIHIFHYHRVYHELAIDHLFMWLGSSVDRALHRYRKVMGFESRLSLIFFRLLFYCEDQISLVFHPQFTYMIFIYSYSYEKELLKIPKRLQQKHQVV